MEAIVAQVSDLADGDMKEVMVGETKVLLTKIKDNFTPSATSAPTTAARSMKAASPGPGSTAPGTSPAST